MNLGLKSYNHKYFIPVEIVEISPYRSAIRCKKCGEVFVTYDRYWWATAKGQHKGLFVRHWLSEHLARSLKCFKIKLRMWNQGDDANERAIAAKRA